MRRLLFSILFLSAFLPLGAQQVRPVFQVKADAFFLNSEFDVSGNKLATSQTLGAVRATPYVGVRFGESHRLMAGFSALQHFGTPGAGPQLEAALWYQYDKRNFTFSAGIFPRATLRGAYSTAVVSDEINLLDAHLEGFLLQWHPGQSHYEIALDWNGKYGVGRREQFNVITSGYSPLTPWLALGWEGMFHHLACSTEAYDVVDDHILHPYVKADAAPFTVLEELSLQAGLLAGMQRDRNTEEKGRIPLGVNLTFTAMKWGFGLRNQFYYGNSQSPLYAEPDCTGKPFGPQLYLRSSFWQVCTDGAAIGYLDRADLFWQKKLGQYVSLAVQFRFFFGQGGYVGCQQLFHASVDLNKITFKRKK